MSPRLSYPVPRYPVIRRWLDTERGAGGYCTSNPTDLDENYSGKQARYLGVLLVVQVHDLEDPIFDLHGRLHSAVFQLCRADIVCQQGSCWVKENKGTHNQKTLATSERFQRWMG